MISVDFYVTGSDRRALNGKREAKLRAIADDLRGKVDRGRKLLAVATPTPEQVQKILEFKRTIIQELVTRIEVFAGKSIMVNLELNDKAQPLEVVNDNGDDLRIVTAPL